MFNIVISMLFVVLLALDFARELFRKRVRPAHLIMRAFMAVAWCALIK